MPFQKGQSGNPRGRPSGRQAVVDRMDYLLAKYRSGEVLALVSDKKAFSRLPAFDAMILRRIAEALEDGGGSSMDKLLDRVIGKPVQSVASTVDFRSSMTLDDRRKEAQEKAKRLLEKARERSGT